MNTKSSFALGAAIASGITLIAISPFLSVRPAEFSAQPHLDETSLLIPTWCSSVIQETATLTLHPLDITDHWDSGVRSIGIATGNVKERQQAAETVLSQCYGQTITFAGGNEEILVAEELRAMKLREEFGHVMVTVKSNEIVLQVGRNVGR